MEEIDETFAGLVEENVLGPGRDFVGYGSRFRESLAARRACSRSVRRRQLRRGIRILDS